VPGIVDGHVHITGGGGEAGPQTRVPPVPLSRFTAGGTTTVVGVRAVGPSGFSGTARAVIERWTR
jgi:predicted amidohydrolase